MIKKLNILFLILIITLNAYGAVVISTYKKPREINYKYKITDRGKVLIMPDTIFFDFNSSELDLKKYLKTLKYIGDITKNTNIINIIIEGHISSDEEKRLSNNQSRNKKDILFLYDRRDINDLSYTRSYNVYLDITNGSLNKLTNYGLQDLLSEYKDIEKNRRVEFILIENSNDMNIYTNYINNLIMLK
ncbi:hypothetical protein [uncultured Brachyspira sp.]|uniref:hypothetical protein n=1 Tax=uncultured Brachyspira sp. TaxID=221953 RepID=UPI0025E017D0|nr:hypothetical protein [uncultured Brachyspira sp.]